ncbi:PTS fructose transporter subunit IIA [Lactobacillus sp. ESL0731]|uniref:PTS sugar transporter subunit IIA n=1 Tax=unclassified Lactobacillus TaxID=2620435 RepID=UPI0023F93621|nr:MULTISPECIES: PTS fructose transporter subunit IIA [unclassified Lactobacillus]WEV50884.1 PTS fructose transporter subunit IIA [Lactobacillus sp. ESL0700]WEV62015.1 PTS fructose transporter subunit IIA [Lactobacillus sp. ESL0731]
MFKIVIASHGPFAAAMRESLKLFFPEENDIITVSIGEDGLASFQKRMDQAVNSVKGENVLFLADLPYGTPFNEIVKRMSLVGKDSEILAGVNMPTLIEAVNLKNQGFSVEKAVPKLFESSKLQSYTEKLNSLGNADDE